jgi:hypothetical protein
MTLVKLANIRIIIPNIGSKINPILFDTEFL